MKRALISVFDKTGIVEFAKSLDSMGWEIISTGGTSKKLKEEGIKVQDIPVLPSVSDAFRCHGSPEYHLLHWDAGSSLCRQNIRGT